MLMSIELKNITYTYSPGTAYEIHALKDINLEIPDGQFIGVIGHTGSGKSTLIQHLNALIRPTSGSVLYNGEDVWEEKYDRRKLRSQVGLVFQYPEHQLFESDVLSELHKARGITIILVSHSMEDVAKYVERLIVVNRGQIAFDDTPREVFSHYQELEAMGLAAPQITYIMHALKQKGLKVDPNATTVEEARDDILRALKEAGSPLLKGGNEK